MTHGSLFSGIGGFDLAAEWMGWINLFHCEWNDFGQRVLKHYWPDAISYGDITKTDLTIWRGRIDVLTGGFPCQPYSMAGKRKGKEDERHLWPEMLRAIREIKPTWVVGENVFGITNWDGGVVFNEVQADLEAEGYEVQPYVLPAASVNAPHRRDRVWFVAHAKCKSIQSSSKRGWGERGRERTEMGSVNSAACSIGPSADTECIRLQRWSETGDIRGEEESSCTKGCKSSIPIKANGEGWDASNPNGIRLRRQGDGVRESELTCKKSKRTNWQDFPTVSPICDRNDGLSDRLSGITFSKWRNESIKAMGNAIVPQVVYQIFKAIERYDRP